MINTKLGSSSTKEEVDIVPINNPPVARRKSSGSDKVSSLGIFYMFLSAINFALMTFASKLLFTHTNALPFELVYMRGLSLVVLNALYSTYINLSIFEVPKFINNILWIRTIVGTVSLTLGFTGTKLIPVSISTTIFNLNPLITGIGGYLFLNEKLSKFDIVGSFTSFFGLILVVRYSQRMSTSIEGIPLYYYLPAFMAAFGAAGVSLLTRKMGKSIHFLINPNWFGMVQAILTTPAWLGVRSSREPLYIPFSEMYAIGLLCLGGWLGQIFMNKSLQIEKAGRVTVVGYVQIPVLFILDALYFHMDIRWQVIVGSVLIIFCSVTMGLMKMFGMLD